MNGDQLHKELPEPVRRYFEEVAQVEPPDDLMSKTMAQVESEPRGNRFSLPPVFIAVAATAVAAGVLAVVLLGPNLFRDGGLTGEPPSPSPTPAETPWMTGRELKHALTERWGSDWQKMTVGSELSTVYETETGSGHIQVHPPYDAAAKVFVGADLTEKGAWSARRVQELLAPDAMAWIAETLERALEANGPFFKSTETASGGHICITVVREKHISDWLNVAFRPDPCDVH